MDTFFLQIQHLYAEFPRLPGGGRENAGFSSDSSNRYNILRRKLNKQQNLYKTAIRNTIKERTKDFDNQCIHYNTLND